MRWTILSLLLAFALVAVSCSDDDTDKKDTGVTVDTGPGIDHGQFVDVGPGGDGPVADKSSADAAPKLKVADYIPKDNDIAGWTEDSATGKPGVEAGYTKKDIEDLINGKHDPYAAKGCNAFAMQHYKKTISSTCNGKLEIFLWECPTAADAKSLFDKNKKDGETSAGLTFETVPNAKDMAILADNIPGWEGYGHKGPYIWKIFLHYGGPPCGPTAKPCGVLWMQTMSTKLP
jgi:hypothetical protein